MHLLPMTDDLYAWLLGEATAPPQAPVLPPGGLESPEILRMLRSLSNELGGDASWLMVADGEGVGLISIKEREAAGYWDIGYGVAPERRGRGHAIAAVAALKRVASAAGARGLTAETLPDSGASPRVLERNGFTRTGRHMHPEDGLVDQWRVEWTQ